MSPPPTFCVARYETVAYELTEIVITATAAATAAVAGCSGTSESPGGGNETVAAEDPSAGVTSRQSLRMTVGESVAGSEWTSIAAEYPREYFTVQSAQHEELSLGVDTTSDGTVNESFDESNVSGVNNNAYSFNIGLDTGYELQQGDVVVVEYPAVDNPDEAGEYEVDLTLNDEQSATGTLSIQ